MTAPKRPTIRPGDGDPRHGTLNGYTNLNCRCQPCRDAWAEYCLGQRASRRRRGLEPDDPRHGNPSTYWNWGCRCMHCREAHRVARSRQLQSAKAAS